MSSVKSVFSRCCAYARLALFVESNARITRSQPPPESILDNSFCRFAWFSASASGTSVMTRWTTNASSSSLLALFLLFLLFFLFRRTYVLDVSGVLVFDVKSGSSTPHREFKNAVFPLPGLPNIKARTSRDGKNESAVCTIVGDVELFFFPRLLLPLRESSTCPNRKSSALAFAGDIADFLQPIVGLALSEGSNG